jgi:hypothetical protein
LCVLQALLKWLTCHSLQLFPSEALSITDLRI